LATTTCMYEQFQTIENLKKNDKITVNFFLILKFKKFEWCQKCQNWIRKDKKIENWKFIFS